MGELTRFEQKNLQLFRKLQEIAVIKKEIEEAEKDIKEKLLIGMENNNLISIDNDYVRINYIASSSSESINASEIRAKDPALYNELLGKYGKVTIRKPYIKIAAK